MGGDQATLSYFCGRKDSKHGSFKMMGGERKKGDKSEASKGRGLREGQYVLSVLFILF